jgi:ribA/ribD-fused uncharacterized protein
LRKQRTGDAPGVGQSEKDRVVPKSVIAFTKASLPYGWMGNMSKFPIDTIWPTAEHFFQAFRFASPDVREEIRKEPNPFKVKLISKKRICEGESLQYKPRSYRDRIVMRMTLQTKLEQHPHLKKLLLATGDAEIIEDCTRRAPSPWGAQLKDGKWIGENWLGKLWMELREELRKS